MAFALDCLCTSLDYLRCSVFVLMTCLRRSIETASHSKLELQLGSAIEVAMFGGQGRAQLVGMFWFVSVSRRLLFKHEDGK